ncbi:MAG: YsnF/AvaK domain-containing protein [Anaerobacillus sp.]|uniref:YsnF/AvaK domain-containing protein n=1 Tax=Anaerobacillus sp. TaxID=1872506 RepID=UPI00391D1FD0
MGKFIIIGALVGGIIGWLFNFSIILAIIMGLIIGILSYTLTANRGILVAATSPKAQKIMLQKELLGISKKRVKTGEVKIHKEVVQDKKTITVPIKREEMVIEAGMDQEIRIPLKEEKVEVSKHPVRLAEVSITKRQIEEMEQVKAILKEEQAHYEVKGNVDIDEQDK